MAKPSITALILSGGQAKRMGGIDKGLVSFNSKPMISHVIERIAPQVDIIVINANRELDRYHQFGYEVISDDIAGFAGPLAGVLKGLQTMQSEYLLTVPCDAPFLPHDLADSLLEALESQKTIMAVASTEQHIQPVFALYTKQALSSLSQYLAREEHKVETWQRSIHAAITIFSDAQAFANINTLSDLNLAEQSATTS